MRTTLLVAVIALVAMFGAFSWLPGGTAGTDPTNPKRAIYSWGGIDFETTILVKEDAPQLLRAEMMATRWKPQKLGISGVTDPYQPIERKLEITRRCLEVLAEFRNPVSIVTKNRLVTRDIDILSRMAERGLAKVALSVTTLDRVLARTMEPRASTPTASPC